MQDGMCMLQMECFSGWPRGGSNFASLFQVLQTHVLKASNVPFCTSLPDNNTSLTQQEFQIVICKIVLLTHDSSKKPLFLEGFGP